MTRAAALLLLTAAGCAGPRVITLPDEEGRPADVVALKPPKPGDTVVVEPTRTARTTRPRIFVRPVDLAQLTPAQRRLVEALPPGPSVFTLYYEEGTTRLVPSSRAQLDALLADVRRRGAAVDIEVSGHTDRKGRDADNDQLSQDRAEVVLMQLGRDGVPLARMTAVGRGERNPRVSTADGVDEPANRRVEVIVR